MKILQIFLALVAVLIIGGFGFFAFTEPPVIQQDVSKEIPNDRFAN